MIQNQKLIHLLSRVPNMIATTSEVLLLIGGQFR